MDEKELYRQKQEAQLNQWKAEVDKLKAQAEEASADTQIEMKQKIEELEGRIEEGRSKMTQLAEAGGDAWDSVQREVDDFISRTKSAMDAAAEEFKK